jgi:hypothetical protein
MTTNSGVASQLPLQECSCVPRPFQTSDVLITNRQGLTGKHFLQWLYKADAQRRNRICDTSNVWKCIEICSCSIRPLGKRCFNDSPKSNQSLGKRYADLLPKRNHSMGKWYVGTFPKSRQPVGKCYASPPAESCQRRRRRSYGPLHSRTTSRLRQRYDHRVFPATSYCAKNARQWNPSSTNTFSVR